MPDPTEPSENSSEPAPEDHVEGREGLASDLRPGAATPFRPASYDPVSLRHIDWPSAFPLVHLFRGFRLAVHPSKLILALAGVLLLYVGGRTLDGIWFDRHLAFPGEAGAFDAFVSDMEEARQTRSFRGVRLQQRAEAEGMYGNWRQRAARDTNERAADVDVGDIKKYLLAEREREVKRARTDYDSYAQRINADRNLSEDQRKEALDAARYERDGAIRNAYDEVARAWDQITQIRGRGLFAEFYQYETEQFDNGLKAILALDIRGVLGSLYRMLYVGPLWGLSQHPLYFTLFFLWFLILAAIFGGAISRIAAVQVARDEKISLRSALRFSTGKFVSFISAPLIPVLIIVVIGLIVAFVGLLGNIPWLGELVIGIAFFLALVAGFLITLVLIGLIGGFSLMYPTIAAEGTDSFDAISRSFSYLYARPWRLAFYALAAMLYGAITYLFVRLFVWLVLISSHTAAALFIWRDAAGQDDVLHAMWPPPPSYTDLSYSIPFINLTPIQDFSAVLLSFWIYLMIALVAAYAVSLYFSISTIIYFLMRREVDATELDDVYLDPHDEELGGYSDVPEADTEAPIEPEEPAEAKAE